MIVWIIGLSGSGKTTLGSQVVKIVRKTKLKLKNISKKNINFLSNSQILEKIVKNPRKINFNGISIDTRSIKKDNLFLALNGKKINGNKFIKKAFKKGASCVVSQSIKKSRKKIIKAKNISDKTENFCAPPL
mgnify:CR=1 FL=1